MCGQKTHFRDEKVHFEIQGTSYAQAEVWDKAKSQVDGVLFMMLNAQSGLHISVGMEKSPEDLKSQDNRVPIKLTSVMVGRQIPQRNQEAQPHSLITGPTELCQLKSDYG